MEVATVIGVVLFFFLFITAVARAAWVSGGDTQKLAGKQYYYGRKKAVMTDRELGFYRRLEKIVADKYYIFPQMHLSAMMFNKTGGRYRRIAFQRINRTSVDFVLCDKDTLSPVYAIELDDRTHDTELRMKRDLGVEMMLEGVGIPLVRFRNVERMADDEIVEKLREAYAESYGSKAL